MKTIIINKKVCVCLYGLLNNIRKVINALLEATYHAKKDDSHHFSHKTYNLMTLYVDDVMLGMSHASAVRINACVYAVFLLYGSAFRRG